MVEDEHLEVNAGAEGTLQAREEGGVAVKVFAEVRPRFFGVDEAYFLAFFDEIGQEAQEGTVFDVEVLDVGRANPKGVFHFGDKGEDFLKMGFVGDVVGHDG